MDETTVEELKSILTKVVGENESELKNQTQSSFNTTSL